MREPLWGINRSTSKNFNGEGISWGECKTAVTHIFEKIAFLQNWKPYSIMQILTNPYNHRLNSFYDIRH